MTTPNENSDFAVDGWTRDQPRPDFPSDDTAPAGAGEERDRFENEEGCAPHTYSALAHEVDYNDLPTYPARPHFHQHHLHMLPDTQLVAYDVSMDGILGDCVCVCVC